MLPGPDVVATRPDAVSFFNSDAYHAYNGTAADVLRVEHHDGDRLVGTATGVVAGGCWTCGHRAPFGGLDLVRDGEPFPAIGALVGAVGLELAARGIAGARVRCRPQAYGRAERGSVHALLEAGFRVERAHVNHHLDLTGVPSAEHYLRGLSDSARNMVRRGLDLGLELRAASTEDDWAAGHAVLAANKAAKGRTMHLGLDYLLGLRAVAPGMARLLTLSESGKPPCAAALTYRLRPDLELLVAWGDAHHELPRSPMNLLAYRLVERAIAEGVRLVDLGISSDGDGRLNPGLAFFKERIGAVADLRFDLVAAIR